MAAKKADGDLLGEIQAGALNSKSNLADVLRQCIALGGATGSERLREWASRELKGYGLGDDVPPYRLTSSLLYLDGFTMRAHVTGQQVPYNLVPDVARDVLNDDIRIRQPVAELQHIVDSHRRRGEEAVKLSPPNPQELLALINHNIAEAERSRYPFAVPGSPPLPASQVVERVYFKVGLAVFAGILDTVRTTLVELVAEMRAASPAGTSIPSRDATEQAVDIAVYGGKVRRIVVNQVGPHGTGSAAGGTASTGDAAPETKSRKVMWWVVGFAGVVAAVGAILALILH